MISRLHKTREKLGICNANKPKEFQIYEKAVILEQISIMFHFPQRYKLG